MERQQVSSSNIRSIGHDEETEVLEVEFKSGAVYQYSGVSAHLAQNLLGATSVGSYFAANIKDNFQFKRV
jgi:hypothetical protein